MDEGGPTPKFSGEATINDVIIKCVWDEDYGDYVLYLPQIQINEASSDLGISDQLFRISETAVDAEVVFEHAKSLAEAGEDVHQVLLKSEKFAKENIK